jgi:signal transduction histidine kinase
MDKIKNRLQNLSLRKSLVLYIILFAVAAFVLSVGITTGCQMAEERIYTNHPRSEERYFLTNEAGERLGEGGLIGTENILYTVQDKRSLQAIQVLQTLAVPLSFSLCMLAAVLVFYRNKIKKPLAALDKASERIANNDLDFTVDYEGLDEMGRLCASFEKMRFSLQQNNQLMWRQMDQRKRLNAAFAHDLRTPLTVLKGYSELLQLPNDSLAVKETALTMSKHINRLERYVDSMSTLQRMEDIVPECQRVELDKFADHAEQMVRMICQKAGNQYQFHTYLQSKVAFLDSEMFSQVMENLVSNAAYHADSSVEVTFSELDDMVRVTVTDDGAGFSAESLENAAEPYYTESSDRSNHFGLGLYICKILCECHNGSLKISNTDQGGMVTAFFKKEKLQ